MGWRIDADAMVEIDRILETPIADSIGPEFMAPPVRKKPNRLDLIAVAAGQCRCVSGLRTSRDADSSGRAENGERRNVGDSSPLWETTYGNC
jgi:hypothetical protein